MATTTKQEQEKTQEARVLFGSKKTEQFRVLKGLCLHLSPSKIYRAYEQVELTEDRYKIHAHQVETEEQYQSQFKLGNRDKK